MPAISIIGALGILASVASIATAFTGSGGGGQEGVPQGTPPPEAKAPSLQPPPGSFAGADKAALSIVPPGLQGLDPTQQRSRVATMATQGEGGAYSTDAVQSYYKSLVLNDLVGSTGGAIRADTGFSDIEKQYITQGLGKQTYDDSSGSYLDALLRK